MIYVVMVLIILLTIWMIAMPFFVDAKTIEESSKSHSSLSEILSRKQQLYTAVKELEFDLNTGKLSKQDFDELNTNLRLEIAELIKKSRSPIN